MRWLWISALAFGLSGCAVPGPESATQRQPAPSDHWSLAYGVQLESRPDQRDLVAGEYLAAEFMGAQL